MEIKSMEISVVIPTYNRNALLKKTLQGLCEQTRLEWLKEVIIVSDGSIDATAGTVKEFLARLPIKFLEQPKRGVTRARNLGLREVRSSIVLLLDDDVIPDRQLVAEHVTFHTQMPTSEAVLQGYVTWLPELRITHFMRWYGEFGGLFGFSLLKDGQEADARYLYTCNISFKTDFLRAQGGFNETLTVLEDHELGYRLSRQGMKMFFRRTAVGYHNQTFTFEEACTRLRSYSVGLRAFNATDAGREMSKRNARLSFRLAKIGARVMVFIFYPLRFLLDSDVRLPNAVYRLFYWYYATHRAFWSRAGAQDSLDQANIFVK
jgi:glycosyltransferase involved in cell wall biosynthesis